MTEKELFQITTVDGRTNFEPGELLEVAAEWNLDSPPDRAEVRLVWYTRGKGDTDVAVLKTIPWDAPQARDNRRCEILLPESPYGFSGTLISLVWAVELVLGKKHSTRLDLIVAPGAKEIQLTPIDE
jgi:hypothetical protein